ncbi:protein kinase [Streptomyces sp. NPDC048441]|uniref:protein kinase domain-containing protein n=1 Tax=Streptomyces sp. NPDC048441 TaxID=3365552 RepID=UPI003710499A
MKPEDLIAGRYELVEKLGRGGMGEVWAARDRSLRRDVALKLLDLGGGVHPDLPQRFEREAVAAAQINHPNVAALYDRGVHEDMLFLVMEKVEGATLADHLHGENSMTLARALEITGEICRALVAAHRAQVIHYDIKPHNIMITPDGQVKVVDFGIAGFVQTAFTLARSSQLQPAGTVEYGAPEQFLAERGDERSDLYALGGVLFALLAGRAPFTGHNWLAVIRRKAEEEAPRLDVLRPDLLPEVTALVAELLRRDPGQRPRSARQVHDRLQQLRAAALDPKDAGRLTPPATTVAPPDSVSPQAAPRIHVAHAARRETSLDSGNYRYHRIRVFLEGDDDGDLDRVTKVVYHLHPTFPEPDRVVTDRTTEFELKMSAWGEFALTADVHVEGRQTPLRLERYLNF